MQLTKEEIAAVDAVMAKFSGSQMRKEANVMSTGATAEGAEAVPSEVHLSDIIAQVPSYGHFLQDLPGNHGYGMDLVSAVTVIGETALYKIGTERTGSTVLANPAPTHSLPTAKVTITQKQHVASVDLSDQEIRFNIQRGTLEQTIMKALAEGMIRTCEASIINADTNSAGTGNINSDDQAAATTLGADHPYLAFDGLRDVAIAGSNTVAVGSFDYADLTAVRKLTGSYAAQNMRDCAFIFETQTYLGALDFTQFQKANESGKDSTVGTGAITNIAGSDLYVNRDFPLTPADGKADGATPSNNTTGGFLYFYKPAVQFGFGSALEMETERIPTRGIKIYASFYFGFTVLYQKAGETSKSVAVGRNVTL